jgi:hypothetical protein
MRLPLDRVRANIQLGLRVEDALSRAIVEKEAMPYKQRDLEIIDDATGLPKYRNRVGNRERFRASAHNPPCRLYLLIVSQNARWDDRWSVIPLTEQ